MGHADVGIKDHKLSSDALSTSGDYLIRGFGYWFVSFLALGAGEYYRAGSFILSNFMELLLFSCPTFVCFVKYNMVYDVPDLSNVSSEFKLTEGHKELIKRSRSQVIGFAAIFCGIVALLDLVLLYLVSPTSYSDIVLATFSPIWVSRCLYVLVLLGVYAAYTGWIHKHRNQDDVFLVRFEVFLPIVTSICLNYYTGLHLFRADFFPGDLVVPAIVLFCVVIVGRLQEKGTSSSAFKFALMVVLLFVVALATYIVLSAKEIENYAVLSLGNALVAGLLGLYLGTFELWRKASLLGDERKRYELVGLPPPTALAVQAKQRRFYLASLTAQVLAFTWWPLIFLVAERFGVVFLIGTFLHSLLALILWFNQWEKKRSSPYWRNAKIIFGFAMFGILFFDGVFYTPIDGFELQEEIHWVATLLIGLLIAIFVTLSVQPVKSFYQKWTHTGSRLRFFFASKNRYDMFALGVGLSLLALVFVMVLFLLTPTESQTLRSKIVLLFGYYFVVWPGFILTYYNRGFVGEKVKSNESESEDQK